MKQRLLFVVAFAIFQFSEQVNAPNPMPNPPNRIPNLSIRKRIPSNRIPISPNRVPNPIPTASSDKYAPYSESIQDSRSDQTFSSDSRSVNVQIDEILKDLPTLGGSMGKRSTDTKLQSSASLKSSLKRRSFSSPGSSSDMSPPKPCLRKCVSFNDIPVRIEPAEVVDGLFWINKKKFFKTVKLKVQLHGPQSLENRFLNALVAVIQNNYLMFERIYIYRLSFGASEIVLDQSEVTENEKEPIPFPDLETIEELQVEKDTIEQKLVNLFHMLEPAYLLNEELYNMLNDNFNGKTKISQKQFEELDEESSIVTDVTTQFDSVFRNFPIKTYRTHLQNIRKTVANFEGGKINRAAADEFFATDVIELKKFYSKMDDALNVAKTIDFKNLQASTKKFHNSVKKILKVDKALPPNSSYQKVSSLWNIFKKKSKK